MSEQRRIVGVDYGRKRVGLAISDPLRMFAQPLGTYDPRTAVDVLKDLHSSSALETIVVGWPLLLDGSAGEATQRVQEYVNRLRNALPGVDVVTWDERFSSQIASQLLVEARPRRRPRKSEGLHDAVAAAVILQDYLDR
ncbi:MAG: Holliday junction resolvase RuvX [Rhodothermales bacterium]